MGMVAYFKLLEPSELKLLCTKPDEFEDVLFPLDAEDPFEGQLCLEKDWHMLHYALSKTKDPGDAPLSMAVLGGNEMGPDLGYGHGRLIHSGMVEEIYQALCEVDFDECYESIDRNDPSLSDVYGGFEFDESEKNFLRKLSQDLREFYKHAHENNYAVFAYLA